MHSTLLLKAGFPAARLQISGPCLDKLWSRHRARMVSLRALSGGGCWSMRQKPGFGFLNAVWNSATSAKRTMYF